jgi:hypothetical protein
MYLFFKKFFVFETSVDFVGFCVLVSPEDRVRGALWGGRWQGTGKAAGGGGGKEKHRDGKRKELTKRRPTEDTPRNTVANALRLHLRNFALHVMRGNYSYTVKVKWTVHGAFCVS